jgi:UDP-N-acetylglucosamine acyltransferase
MGTEIHPTAIIDESAELASGVSIGAYSVVGPSVCIGEGTRIAPHVVISKNTRIGKENRIFQFASVGEDPQDLKYAGEETWLEIGDRNQIRESATLHRGTTQDQGITKIGNDNLLMAYTHVAHDCQFGNDVILSTQATVAGHVKIDDGAIVGGLVGIHQFCHIGSHCMLGGGSIILKDVPAYIMTGGNPASAYGMNFEGMKRRGYSKEVIASLREAYKLVYRKGLTLEKAMQAIEELEQSSELRVFIQSIKCSTRGILR